MFNLCKKCKCDNITCSKNKNKRIIFIMLNITDRCFNNCDYCWHKKHNRISIYKKDMTKSNIDNLINFIKSKYINSNIIFGFMGGEPTLNTNIIFYAIDELKKIKNNYFIELYTHLNTNLNDFEKILLKYSNIKTYISLENKIIDNIDLSFYKKYQNKKYFIYNIVVNKDNYFNLEEILMYYYNNGLYSDFNILFDMSGFNFDKEILKKELINIYNNKYLKILNFKNNDPNSYKDKFNNFYVDYFSDEKFYLTHFNKSKSVGDVFTNINENIILNLDLKCENCKYNNICQLNKLYFLDENLCFHINKNICEPYKILYQIKEEN